MKNEKTEYQNLKNNPLSYDLKSFKIHYARPFYLLAYISFFGVVILILGVLYNLIFDANIVDIFGGVSGNVDGGILGNMFGMPLAFFIMISILYLLLVFPSVIPLKRNCKRQVITFNPLKISRVASDGFNGGSVFEKIEKIYTVNKIESFSITNRYVIVNGEIEYLRKTTNNHNDNVYNGNKLIQQVKIPRIFSNEKILIDYLEQNK